MAIEMKLLDNPEAFPVSGRIACQGIKGAYSYFAAQKMFPQGKEIFFKTFDAVFEAVKSGMCDYGVVPIENNSYGSVKAVYGLLEREHVYIIRSERLLICHQLMARPGTEMKDLTAVYSHEQALGQCSGYIKGLSDNVRVIPSLNTAVAARYVAESKEAGEAAIASPECAALYGLVPLNKHVQDSDNNYTRFVCLSREPLIYPGANRISLILSIAHKPGSLYGILGKFADLGINMLKLESSPIVGRDFEFNFYIDIEAQAANEKVRKMLEEIQVSCPEFIFLGNYTET
ncbi:MAG TPA: prephenate dehydratase domain-containing protein [Lachnospiraceae bacterium]|nr:prephenate dehydratase domain-containing protein [Lachnospiraceae bacterium]